MPTRETDHGPGPFPVLRPDLQVSFWNQLQAVRESYLGPALEHTVAAMATREIDAELDDLVSTERLARLASLGIRGEIFLPVPCVLRARPCLLGYYRLLYGFSQKEFYGKGPFGKFRAMEERDRLTPRTEALLRQLCHSLVQSGQMLLDGLARPSTESVHELQLLTLGGQLRGRWNTGVGRDATAEVVGLIRGLVGGYAQAADERSITLENDSGRTVSIEFFSEPDVRITQRLPDRLRPILSIEIKGGGDVSNIHNRIGEAEKSHQKARAAGFLEFWTLLRARVVPAKAEAESPTTSHFFNLDGIQDPTHPEYAEFRELLCLRLGIQSPGCRKRTRAPR